MKQKDNHRLPLKIIILLQTCFFFSCEDKINIDIPDSEKKLVVDGFIFKTGFKKQKHYIKLSRSSNFNDSTQNKESIVNDATITLNHLNNSPLLFNHYYNGYYYITDSSIQYNEPYKIRIETSDNKIYESTYQNVIPPVRIDSVSHLPYEYLQDNGYFFTIVDSEKRDHIVASFTDRKGEDNFYGFYFSSDNFILSKMKIISDSEFGDGTKVPFEYLWFTKSVTSSSRNYLYQATLNKNAYQFISQAKTLSEPTTPFSTPPASLISNIKNINNPNEQVLGFFEIASVDIKRFTW